jgi:hypothetical protein
MWCIQKDANSADVKEKDDQNEWSKHVGCFGCLYHHDGVFEVLGSQR